MGTTDRYERAERTTLRIRERVAETVAVLKWAWAMRRRFERAQEFLRNHARRKPSSRG